MGLSIEHTPPMSWGYADNIRTHLQELVIHSNIRFSELLTQITFLHLFFP